VQTGVGSELTKRELEAHVVRKAVRPVEILAADRAQELVVRGAATESSRAERNTRGGAPQKARTIGIRTHNPSARIAPRRARRRGGELRRSPVESADDGQEDGEGDDQSARRLHQLRDVLHRQASASTKWVQHLGVADGSLLPHNKKLREERLASPPYT